MLCTKIAEVVAGAPATPGSFGQVSVLPVMDYSIIDRMPSLDRVKVLYNPVRASCEVSIAPFERARLHLRQQSVLLHLGLGVSRIRGGVLRRRTCFPWQEEGSALDCGAR